MLANAAIQPGLKMGLSANDLTGLVHDLTPGLINHAGGVD
jgi:hypothetical protein